MKYGPLPPHAQPPTMPPMVSARNGSAALPPIHHKPTARQNAKRLILQGFRGACPHRVLGEFLYRYKLHQVFSFALCGNLSILKRKHIANHTKPHFAKINFRLPFHAHPFHLIHVVLLRRIIPYSAAFMQLRVRGKPAHGTP